MSDIKEVIAYYKAEQKRKASEHRIKHQHDGLCQPFTDKEFAQKLHDYKNNMREEVLKKDQALNS